MHSIFLLSLLSALPLTQRGSTPAEEPQEAVQPVEEVEAKPVLQDEPAKGRRSAGKKTVGHTALGWAPGNGGGLWLNPAGEASPELTAMALLVLAREGTSMRMGPDKQMVLTGVKALVGQLDDRKAIDEASFEEIDKEVLSALALSIHARLASYRILKRYGVFYMDRALTQERLGRVFPNSGFGRTSQDDTRLFYLLLCKQVQISMRPGASSVSLATPTGKMETQRMKSWLDRSLKDTNADAARLLTLFLGHLILAPSKEPPLSDGVTGFLWNRAQGMMSVEKKKAGGELSPRLLCLDTLIRTEFLNDAFPKELRESRKAQLEKWEGQLISRMAEQKGLRRDDLYRLMALAQLRGATPVWRLPESPESKEPEKRWR